MVWLSGGLLLRLKRVAFGLFWGHTAKTRKLGMRDATVEQLVWWGGLLDAYSRDFGVSLKFSTKIIKSSEAK